MLEDKGKEFFDVHSWFEEKYKEKSSSRYWTFKIALNLFLQNDGRIIVETGTTRMVDDWGAGSSTVLFGEVVKKYGGLLYTVDIDPKNIETCKNITFPYKQNIEYVVDDSLHFLENYKGQIDLIYLDSLDFPLDGSDPLPCQEHQLKELKLALPRLGYGGIILLDDNDFPNGGKAKLSKEYLNKENYMCIMDSQQSLWISL